MKCPHCNTAVNLDFEDSVSGVYRAKDYEQTGTGYQLAWDHCPECGELIVLLQHGRCIQRAGEDDYVWDFLKSVDAEEVLYPKYLARRVEPEVPNGYKAEFLEACSVLPLSPKASAALSRRILQSILRNEFNIRHRNLAQEIDDFIQLKNLPSHLTQAVDAVRNIGNFAAHPLKDTNTGEIVDVELGEAEWLLDVIEALFDYAFVQPQRLEERKKRLNQKLRALGKPPMKG
jgi:hypothetical protein